MTTPRHVHRPAHRDGNDLAFDVVGFADVGPAVGTGSGARLRTTRRW